MGIVQKLTKKCEMLKIVTASLLLIHEILCYLIKMSTKNKCIHASDVLMKFQSLFPHWPKKEAKQLPRGCAILLQRKQDTVKWLGMS